MRLFTVGHSNQTLPELIALLQSHGVNAVADVRSIPFSRRLPQFNRPELEAQLLAGALSTFSWAKSLVHVATNLRRTTVCRLPMSAWLSCV